MGSRLNEIAELRKRVEALEQQLGERTQVYTAFIPGSLPPGKPYLCPVCGGSGVLSDIPMYGGCTSTVPLTRTCHACGGKGVLWG